MARITMLDIAKACGVSKNTVSLALRHDTQIPAKTRQRIEKVAKQMGYQRNPVVAHLMSQLRNDRSTQYEATLALVNANKDARAFRTHPTIPTYVKGCRAQAKLRGYRLDTFWMHDPKLTATSFNRILQTRNIRGLILVGLMEDNHLPAHLGPVWEQHACVVTGVRTREPTLSFACVDHHMLALDAFEHAIRLGYRRPGLVLDEAIDWLVEKRFTAGIQAGQQAVPVSRRVPAFLQVKEAEKDLSLLDAWLKRYQPDVLFTLYNDLRQWLNTLGYRTPEDIGLIQLELRDDHRDWAGMQQHNEIVGAVAVDMVIAQIHHGDFTLPQHPVSTMVQPTWKSGPSVSLSLPSG